METEKYFTDYENLEIHELMLKDRPRQEAYYKAIMSNTEMFRDKIVLDVGAGTGILSIFCAKAGAKLVYAVEASDVAKLAVEIVQENKLTNQIKVINSKIENFQLPSDAEKVDVIVSEWMGFYLLHESMLNSVLFARDNFLKPDGKMFPQYATLFVAPCSVQSRFSYWDNVDGVSLGKFAKKLRLDKSKKPEILNLNPKDLLHDGLIMAWFDLGQITADELNEIKFEEVIPVQKNGVHQGYCIWFDCAFPSKNFEDAVILSTSPSAPQTHWKQCVIVLPDIACQEVEENMPLASRIAIRRNANDSRKYDLEIEILDVNEIEHPMPCNCYMTKCILAKAHIKSISKE